MSGNSSGARDYIPPVIAASASMSAADVELTKVRQSLAGAAGVAPKMTPEELEELRLKREAQNRKWTIGSASVASVSVVSALVAMYWEASMIAYMAFIFPLMTAPYMVIQRRQLNKHPTLREEHNAIRMEVNRLQRENNQLGLEITELQQQVGKLQAVETKLESIAASQGKTVSELRTMVSENAETLREMRKIQETEVMQEVMTAMVNSDRSRDWRIDESEIDVLMLRLKMLPCVRKRKNFDEDNLRRQLLLASPRSSLVTMARLTTDLLEEEDLELGRKKGARKPPLPMMPELE